MVHVQIFLLRHRSRNSAGVNVNPYKEGNSPSTISERAQRSHKNDGHPHRLRTYFFFVACLWQVPPDYLQVRLTVRPQGSMRLYGRRDLPLVEASMAASATVELREDASMVSDSQSTG